MTTTPTTLSHSLNIDTAGTSRVDRYTVDGSTLRIDRNVDGENPSTVIYGLCIPVVTRSAANRAARIAFAAMDCPARDRYELRAIAYPAELAGDSGCTGAFLVRDRNAADGQAGTVVKGMTTLASKAIAQATEKQANKVHATAIATGTASKHAGNAGRALLAIESADDRRKALQAIQKYAAHAAGVVVVKRSQRGARRTAVKASAAARKAS